jgi:hypothetical protein
MVSTEHSCLPSSSSGFDTRPSHCFLFYYKKNKYIYFRKPPRRLRLYLVPLALVHASRIRQLINVRFWAPFLHRTSVTRTCALVFLSRRSMPVFLHAVHSPPNGRIGFMRKNKQQWFLSPLSIQMAPRKRCLRNQIEYAGCKQASKQASKHPSISTGNGITMRE